MWEIIKSLICYFEEYQKILDSYRAGEQTGTEKHVRPDALVKSVSVLEIKHCKNSACYIWVKLALINEIWEEAELVSHLAREQVHMGADSFWEMLYLC